MIRPSGLTWSSFGRIVSVETRFVTSSTASSRLDTVSSGPTSAEVARVHVQPHHVAQQPAHHARRFRHHRRRAARPSPRSRGNRAARDRFSSSPPFACGFAPMRRSPSGASAAISGRSAPFVVEELLGPVALHPLFEDADVVGLRRQLRQRNLVRAERALDLHSVHHLRPRPALRDCAARSSATAAARESRARARRAGSRGSARSRGRASPP